MPINSDPHRAQLLIRFLVHQALNTIEPWEAWDDKISSASWEMQPQLTDRGRMLFLRNTQKHSKDSETSVHTLNIVAQMLICH